MEVNKTKVKLLRIYIASIILLALLSHIAFCFADNTSKEGNSMTDPPSTLLTNIIPYVLGTISGFLIAVFAEPLRQKLFKPKLELEFKEGLDFFTLTPTDIGSAYYIRARVTNTKRNPARGCRAYLIDIKKVNDRGEIKQTPYCDSIPLAWSLQETGQQYNGIDLSKGVNQFVDVIETHPSTELHDIFIPQIRVKPYRYNSLWREQGIFLFKIQVCAENADPETIELKFNWSGRWNDFEVNDIKNPPEA